MNPIGPRVPRSACGKPLHWFARRWVAELVLDGHGQGEVARKFELSTGYVQQLTRDALREGGVPGGSLPRARALRSEEL